jgi:hypothetical protein
MLWNQKSRERERGGGSAAAAGGPTAAHGGRPPPDGGGSRFLHFRKARDEMNDFAFFARDRIGVEAGEKGGQSPENPRVSTLDPAVSAHFPPLSTPPAPPSRSHGEARPFPLPLLSSDRRRRRPFLFFWRSGWATVVVLGWRGGGVDWTHGSGSRFPASHDAIPTSKGKNPPLAPPCSFFLVACVDPLFLLLFIIRFE